MLNTYYLYIITYYHTAYHSQTSVFRSYKPTHSNARYSSPLEYNYKNQYSDCYNAILSTASGMHALGIQNAQYAVELAICH